MNRAIKTAIGITAALTIAMGSVPLAQTGIDFSISVSAATVVESGTCGTSATWSLDSDGVLTIGGTGAMANYTDETEEPWNARKDQIKSIVIGEEITSIGANAFLNCSSLTGTVIIPGNVTSVGTNAFGSTGITGLEFAYNNYSKLETIRSGAFAQCSSLTGTVTIPASVTSIGDSAFVKTGITGLQFAEGSQLETIGAGTFNYCSNLTGTVTIPASVTSIGTNAFNNINSDAVIELLYDGASGVDNIASFNTANKIIVHSQAVHDKIITFNTNCEYAVVVSGSCGTSATLSLNADGVLTIGGSGSISTYDIFSLIDFTKYDIKSIIIGSEITGIGENAFNNINSDAVIELLYDGASGVDNIASFNTANKVIVHSKAVYDKIITFNTNCEYAVVASGTCGTSATWSLNAEGVMTIGGTGAMTSYFDTNIKPWDTYKDQIKSIVIGDGITSVGDRTFKECKNLTGTVTIPASVTSIGTDAFSNTGITGLTFAEGSKLGTIGSIAIPKITLTSN